MPQHEHDTLGLSQAAERRHAHALDRARKAIRRLDQAGEPITFQAVAREAGVSRQFLYAAGELRSEIERLRSAHPGSHDPPLPAAQRATHASLKARNQTLLDENRRLRDELAGLRDELASAWGQVRALQRENAAGRPRSARALTRARRTARRQGVPGAPPAKLVQRTTSAYLSPESTSEHPDTARLPPNPGCWHRSKRQWLVGEPAANHPFRMILKRLFVVTMARASRETGASRCR